MRVSEFLVETRVIADLASEDKIGVLRELVRQLCINGERLPVGEEDIVQALLERENLGSTGVGDGVAIPHARIAGLKKIIACFGRKKAGIAFESVDHQPATLFFLLLAPDDTSGTHLKALGTISRLLRLRLFRERLLKAVDRHAIYSAFVEEDGKR